MGRKWGTNTVERKYVQRKYGRERRRGDLELLGIRRRRASHSLRLNPTQFRRTKREGKNSKKSPSIRNRFITFVFRAIGLLPNECNKGKSKSHPSDPVSASGPAVSLKNSRK